MTSPSLPPNVSVTAQQSRFHLDLDRPSGNKDLLIKDLTLTIVQRELLSNATLHLQPNRRYVLIGRNGVGKSTLLSALAHGSIPGIPSHLRILLQRQTESLDSAEGQGKSVLEHVMTSDATLERLRSESQRLSDALERDGPDAVAVYRQVVHERLVEKLKRARVVAQRQSGSRGLDARRKLRALEEEVDQSERNSDDPIALDAVMDQAGRLLSDIQQDLESFDIPSIEPRARTILRGLGFTSAMLAQPPSQLSGGWHTRLRLASTLFQKTDILLLDEPTNFLDLPSIIWLETFLQSRSTTLICVTHDRDFADTIAQDLLVLRNASIEVFKGNLSTYELSRAVSVRHMARLKAASERQTKHMESTISESVRAARRSGDHKKLRQAASRRKRIDERTGLQSSARGGRFKLSRDLAGYHASRREAIEVPGFEPEVKLVFPSEPAGLRIPGAIVSLGNVGFAYPGQITVLQMANVTVHPGDRIGVCGLNGSGKSTLLALITGSLVPSRGIMTKHPRASIGVFNQRSAEELDAISRRDPHLTALSHVMSLSDTNTEKEIRALLSGLGLTGRVASEVPIALLSGGQKVRLALAKLVCVANGGPPHCLVLDEITTHLDSDTVLALAKALKHYQGAIVLVTHDRFFMRCVVEGQSAVSRDQQGTTGADSDDNEESGSETDTDDPSGFQRQRRVFVLEKGRLEALEDGITEYEDRVGHI